MRGARMVVSQINAFSPPEDKQRTGGLRVYPSAATRYTDSLIMSQVEEITERIQQQSGFLREITQTVESVIVGQSQLLESLLIGLLADGHVLLEGVPGLAKSLAVQSLAAALGGEFHRLQFTPDLLPSDLIGTQVYNPKTGEWTVHEGPVFANFVLADEINRAPAKVQSGLLEAMQERQVTLAGESRALPSPSATAVVG